MTTKETSGSVEAVNVPVVETKKPSELLDRELEIVVHNFFVEHLSGHDIDDNALESLKRKWTMESKRAIHLERRKEYKKNKEEEEKMTEEEKRQKKEEEEKMTEEEKRQQREQLLEKRKEIARNFLLKEVKDFSVKAESAVRRLIPELADKRDAALRYKAAMDWLKDSPKDGKHRAVVVVSIDVDQFKAINDRYTHMHGDKLLQAVGTSLFDGVRPDSDLPIHASGDEFGVILELEQPVREGEATPPDWNNLTQIVLKRVLNNASKVLRPDGAIQEFSTGFTVIEDPDAMEFREAYAKADSYVEFSKNEGVRHRMKGAPMSSTDRIFSEAEVSAVEFSEQEKNDIGLYRNFQRCVEELRKKLNLADSISSNDVIMSAIDCLGKCKKESE